MSPSRLDAFVGQLHERFSHLTDQDIVYAMDEYLEKHEKSFNGRYEDTVLTLNMQGDLPFDRFEAFAKLLRSTICAALLEDQDVMKSDFQPFSANLMQAYYRGGEDGLYEFLAQLYSAKEPEAEPAPLSPSPSPAPTWDSGFLRWVNRPEFSKASSRELGKLSKSEAKAFCAEHIRETRKPNQFPLPAAKLREIDEFLEDRGYRYDQQIIKGIDKIVAEHNNSCLGRHTEVIFRLVNENVLPFDQKGLASKILHDEMC